MTVDEVKVLLRIPQEDTRNDNYLTAILPMLIQYVQQYCRRTFEDKEGNVVLPGGVKVAVAKLAESQMREAGLQSESLARHSQTFAVDVPKSIKDMLRPYRRAVFV